ncbi:ATP synthase I chain [Desulfuromusa kysingii]|uniref:ATP synthase I chain n=1 Tax=Desulfuromusa kysingii TaxID=37625 RepID=A0A1H3VJI9_9BACT|nr:ATP synthase subunit I [Desulfuromusa kysingii]SDZ74957.1 ATP synthase I chain [Desulfuromusa kysingii]
MPQTEQLLAEMAVRNWIILIALVLLSLFWQSYSITFGVLSGGVLVIINYRGLGRSLSKVLGDPQPAMEKGFKRNYLFRLLFIASSIYILLVRGEVHPLALVVGLSVVVINIIITTVKRLY